MPSLLALGPQLFTQLANQSQPSPLADSNLQVYSSLSLPFEFLTQWAQPLSLFRITSLWFPGVYVYTHIFSEKLAITVYLVSVVPGISKSYRGTSSFMNHIVHVHISMLERFLGKQKFHMLQRIYFINFMYCKTCKKKMPSNFCYNKLAQIFY